MRAAPLSRVGRVLWRLLSPVRAGYARRWAPGARRSSGPEVGILLAEVQEAGSKRSRKACQGPVRADRVPGKVLVVAAADLPLPAAAPAAPLPAAPPPEHARRRAGGPRRWRPRLDIAPGAPARCEFCAWQPLGPAHHPRRYAAARVYVPGFTAVDLCPQHLRSASEALAARGQQVQLLTWLSAPPLPRPATADSRRQHPEGRASAAGWSLRPVQAPGLVHATVEVGELRYRCAAHS